MTGKYIKMVNNGLRVTTAVLAVVMASNAYAQASPDAKTSDKAEDGGADIVVTARKRDESILDVPISITALTAQGLADRGIQGFNELNDFVPGLRYQNSSANRNDRGFNTFSMRGMYPGDSPNRQGVTVFVNGVAIPTGSIPGLGSVDQVEVVKGPQSAYFGRATFAGAINFITSAPSLDEWHGKAELSYASFNTVNASVQVEAPIVTDKLAVRIGGTYYHTDGAWENQGFSGKLGERETRSAALEINFQPTDRLNMRFYGTIWADSDGPSAQAVLAEESYNCNPGGSGRAVNGNNYICGGIGSVPTSLMSQNIVLGGLTDYSMITDNGILDADFIDHLGLERRAHQLIGSFNYDLDDYAISGNVGFNKNDWAALTETYNRSDSSYFRAVYLPYNIENASQELRFASTSSKPLQFMVGANHYSEDIFFGVRANGNGTITTLSIPTHYKAETTGLFGSVSYDFGSAVSLSAEGRYQWDKVHHFNANAEGEATFKSFSPRLIATYHITPSADFYASFSRGTRPGTFNTSFYGLSQSVIDAVLAVQEVPYAVPEEKLTNYEIGFKGDLFDRKLQIMASAYYMNWRGRQINQNIPYTTTSDGVTTTQTVTVTLANGRTNLFGLELETTARPTRYLTLQGTFNWAGSKILYTDCAECAAITGNRNPVGNKVSRSPEFSGSASIAYDRPVNDSWDGFGRIDYTYTGKQYATEANLAYTEAANRINVRAGLRNETYSIEVYVQNLFDDDTPTNILRNTNPRNIATEGLNTIVVAPPLPRSFGVKGAYKF